SGVDADAKPRDAIAAEDAEDGTRENQQHLAERLSLQHGEIINHAHRDERPDGGEKFPLLPQIRFARFPDDMGNLAHRAMHWQRAGADVFPDTKRRADSAHEKAEEQNLVAGDAAMKKVHLVERGQLDVRVASESVDRKKERGC